MNRESTYLRKYIILKKDYLNISGINPKGHVKIETRGNKGNISVNIENCQGERDYTINFLKDQGGQVKELDIGRIMTNSRGKGRANIPVNLRELDLRGFSIDEISAILIGKDKDILLGGYINENTGTIERFTQVDIEKEMPMEESLIEELENSIVEPNLDMEEDLLETKFEIEEEAEIEFENEPNLENDPSIEPEIEPTIELERETSVNIHLDMESNTDLEIGIESQEDFQEYEEETRHGNHPLSYEDNYQDLENTRRLNHRNQMTNYILNILRFFPQVQPFKLNLNGYSWWQIDDDGTDPYKGFLPYFNYLMGADYKYPFLSNSTTCFQQINKYGHYLFGMYKEKGETLYYIYGIPGRFILEEHPFRGVTGFNTWYEAIECMGYWLLYIDPMTGDIVHTLNPMIPSL